MKLFEWIPKEVFKEALFPSVIGLLTIISGLIFAYSGYKYRRDIKIYNNTIRQIELLVAKIHNGSRSSYNKLENISTEVKNYDSVLYEYSMERKIFVQEIWDAQIDKPIGSVYPDIKGVKGQIWSPESLYKLLKEESENISIHKFGDILRTVGQYHWRYLIGTLYEISINNENIDKSIMAVKLLNSIVLETDSPPYGKDQLMGGYIEEEILKRIKQSGEVPNFPSLQKWWENIGQKVSEYNCPLFELTKPDNSTSEIEKLSSEEIDEKRRYFELLLDEYPLLVGTEAKCAYLYLLADDIGKAKKLALDVKSIVKTEPMSYLVMAYIYHIGGNISNVKKQISTCLKYCNLNDVKSCLNDNKKFNSLKELYEPMFFP